jgi:hypothetical protein
VAESAGILATEILEKEWQAQVIDAAHLFGWKIAHFRPAKTERGWRTPVQADGKGFPDLVLLHPAKGKMLVRELKAEKGRMRPEQTAWLEWFAACGVDSDIWRPSDFDRMMVELRG